MATTPRSSFTKLPAELRNRIYYLAILEDGEDTCLRLKDHQQPGITRVSREIRSEALPIFYGETTFWIEADLPNQSSGKSGYFKDIALVEQRIGLMNYQMLRKFQVRMGDGCRSYQGTLKLKLNGSMSATIRSMAAPFTQKRENNDVKQFSSLARIWYAYSTDRLPLGDGVPFLRIAAIFILECLFHAEADVWAEVKRGILEQDPGTGGLSQQQFNFFQQMIEHPPVLLSRENLELFRMLELYHQANSLYPEVTQEHSRTLTVCYDFLAGKYDMPHISTTAGYERKPDRTHPSASTELTLEIFKFPALDSDDNAAPDSSSHFSGRSAFDLSPSP
ncbi:MAG: hypothetical protein M1821_009386 [Bathelium mastoideum]|nr:MAG: hypothetical protein M1821_009386 [Bathelium mastoideum]